MCSTHHKIFPAKYIQCHFMTFLFFVVTTQTHPILSLQASLSCAASPTTERAPISFLFRPDIHAGPWSFHIYIRRRHCYKQILVCFDFISYTGYICLLILNILEMVSTEDWCFWKASSVIQRRQIKIKRIFQFCGVKWKLARQNLTKKTKLTASSKLFLN